MSIADIKQRLRDIPGIETLTMTMIAGRQQYNIGGKVIAVDGGASDLVAQEAIRAAMSSEAIAQIPAGAPVSQDGPVSVGASPANAEAASPVSGTASATNSADLIPQVHVTAPAATVQTKATPVSNPASAVSSIEDMMQRHMQKMEDIHKAQLAILQSNLDSQADTVARGVSAVAEKIARQTDDFNAMMGRFTNTVGA